MIDEKEEVWKQYPDYSFIEASNLGRIRTKDRYVPLKNGSKRLVKGHVLKQCLQTNGYMYVTFSANGKTVTLRVHRVIATSFLPNPLGLPEINHIDCDPTNNKLDNLEWCTSQYNSAYRDKLGHTAKHNAPKKSVFAVNTETGEVFWFESQHEAARQLDIDMRRINKVVNDKAKTAGGYWFTENESEITDEKIKEIRAGMHFFGGVISVDSDNFEVLWFESQSEAARQLGVDVGNINAVLKGKRKKTGGCWFCYADENTVKKVRKIFGDKVAKKVEELMRQNQKR